MRSGSSRVAREVDPRWPSVAMTSGRRSAPGCPSSTRRPRPRPGSAPRRRRAPPGEPGPAPPSALAYRLPGRPAPPGGRPGSSTCPASRPERRRRAGPDRSGHSEVREVRIADGDRHRRTWERSGARRHLRHDRLRPRCLDREGNVARELSHTRAGEYIYRWSSISYSIAGFSPHRMVADGTAIGYRVGGRAGRRRRPAARGAPRSRHPMATTVRSTAEARGGDGEHVQHSRQLPIGDRSGAVAVQPAAIPDRRGRRCGPGRVRRRDGPRRAETRQPRPGLGPVGADPQGEIAPPRRPRI